MAERVVAVTLRAKVDEYKRGMAEAAQATRTVGTETERLQQAKESLQTLGRTGVLVGGALAAGLGVAVAKFADFQQAMSYVAATGEDARGSFEQLKEAALDAGASTVFSATESANAIEEMAKAGVDAKDILSGGLKGALDLAAAGGLGVADAAGIAATALKVFNLEGSDMSHVADLLAAGAGKAMGDVSDLSAALAQGGQVAAATGLSIEETTATLAAFASQGLLGSDAGTSFKTMLQRLTPQSAEARKVMDELGVSAYDASGQFIGMAEFAGNLQGALRDLTPEQRNAALSVMFGSDAVRAANVLFREGEAGIRDWTAAVDDQGYAAETAAIRLDNMKGDIEALGGALDSAFIGMGEAADGPGRLFLQTLTGMVDTFNDLPGPAQQTVFWLGAAGAAAGLAGGAYFLAIPKIAEFNDAIGLMGPRAQRAASALGMMAKVGSGVLVGLGVATAASDLLVQALDKIGPSANEVQNRIKTAAEASDLFAVATEKAWTNFGKSDPAKAAKQVEALAGALDKLMSGKRDGQLVDANAISGVMRIGSELAKLAESDLPSAQRQFTLLSEAAGLNTKQQNKLLEIMEPYREALTKVATEQDMAVDSQTLLSLALGEGAAASEEQAASLEELQGVAQDTGTDVNALAASIRNFGSATFDTERAAISFHDAFAELDAQLQEGAGSLDLASEAGRTTRGAMLDVAQSTNDYAASIAAMGGSTAEVQGVLESGRQKIYEVGRALGMSEDAAWAYANQLIATPETIATQVALNGIQKAENDLSYLTRPRFVHIQVQQPVHTGAPMKDWDGSYMGNLYENGKKQAFYQGGFASGIYPGVMGGYQDGNRVFGEAHMGVPWETYISGRAADRNRNIGIWQETGRRLGVDAGGGSSAPAAVYVENPFTGEYMLARVRDVADSSALSATAGFAASRRGGLRR